MKRAVPILLAIVALTSGHTPQPQQTALKWELDELSRYGITHRFIDDATVELTFLVSGHTRVKTLDQPTEAEIRSWVSARGIPILEVDPATIDTNVFAGM